MTPLWLFRRLAVQVRGLSIWVCVLSVAVLVLAIQTMTTAPRTDYPKSSVSQSPYACQVIACTGPTSPVWKGVPHATP